MAMMSPPEESLSCPAPFCVSEPDARRVQSMALPAKKRKSPWESEDQEQAAHPDPLSSCAASDCKRPHLDPTSAAAPPCSSQQHGAPAAHPASVFGMPTGRLEDRFAMTERVLGAGQFGTVRECTDLFTGERLACKTIRKCEKKAEVQNRELRNEMGLMMRLAGHENVVQLRGVFEDEQQVHLVLDLCQGGELFEEVLRRQRFAEEDAAVLFAEIVKSVAFCHSRGVVHRDLKPENLLLNRRLEAGQPLSAAQRPLVKLADFGLATPVEPGQHVKGMAGSPFYMAPEVLTGLYDCKADVWSLGVILYILLCGSPPFWGEKDDDVFKAILKGKPDLTTSPWNLVSSEAKGLIKCLLIQDPARRPSAQKILTHPWIRRHCTARRSLRRSTANAVGQSSVSVV